MFAQFLGLESNPFESGGRAAKIFRHQSFQQNKETLQQVITTEPGIIFLTGVSGAGKTTLLQEVTEELLISDFRVESLDARTIDPKLIVHNDASLATLLQLDVTTEQNGLITKLQESLGNTINIVIFIDHVECLSLDELNKLISDYLHSGHLQRSFIVLVSSIDYYKQVCLTPGLQFKQFLTQGLFLQTMSRLQVGPYIDARLHATNKRCIDFFPQAAIDRIFEISSGVPGGVNNLCAATLILSNLNSQPITDDMVDEAAAFCTLPPLDPEHLNAEFIQSLQQAPLAQQQLLDSANPHPKTSHDKTRLLQKFIQDVAGNKLILLVVLLIATTLVGTWWFSPTPPEPLVLDILKSKQPWSVTKTTIYPLVDEEAETLTPQNELDIVQSTEEPANTLTPLNTSIDPKKAKNKSDFAAAINDKLLNDLLAQANVQLQNNQYTLPDGNNALATFQQILHLDAQNSVALQGVEKIKLRYLARASKAELSGDTSTALINYQQALKASADDHVIRLKIAKLQAKQP